MFILAFFKNLNKIIIDNNSIYGGEYILIDNTASETDKVWINNKTNVMIKYINDRWCITYNDNILAEATTKNTTNPTQLIYINPQLPAGFPYELSSVKIN